MFRLKYDYHNAKVLVKAEAMGIDAGRLLLDGGRVPASGLAENYQKEQLGGLSLRFQSAIREARETLAASHDPQLADLALDRACYEEMAQLARETGSGFLQGYGPPCGGCGQPEGRRPGGPDGEGERVFYPRCCCPAGVCPSGPWPQPGERS